MSMMPLRVAMPNKVMKPISERVVNLTSESQTCPLVENDAAYRHGSEFWQRGEGYIFKTVLGRC